MSSPSSGLRKRLLLLLKLPSCCPSSRLLVLIRSRMLLLLHLRVVRGRGRISPAQGDGEAEEDVALGQHLKFFPSFFFVCFFFKGQEKKRYLVFSLEQRNAEPRSP